MEKDMEFKGYSSYKKTVMEIVSDMEKISEISKELKLENAKKQIDDSIEHLKRDIFTIGIVGEFNRGKSTLINALLGKEILPADITPTTAVLNRVTYDIKPHAEVKFKDNTVKSVRVDQISEYVTKLTKESEQVSTTVEEAILYYPSEYCKNGVEIIDTPGLNDDKTMTDITMSVLSNIDAAIMVIHATSPFSEYESDFLQNKLLTSDLGRVIFVVTRIDCVRPKSQADKVVNNIRERIQEFIIERAKKIYGEDSEEYENHIRKIGKIRIYPVSAIDALEGKMENDEEQLKDSKFIEFEKALEKFLTEERGAIVLQVPLNRTRNTLLDIINAVDMRKNSLNMSQEEYKQKQAKVLEKIEELRKTKQQEKRQIKESSRETFYKIKPMIPKFWKEIEEKLLSYIDHIELEPGDIKDNESRIATQTRIMEDVDKVSKSYIQTHFESIQEVINQSLGEEIIRLDKYAVEFEESMEAIRVIFESDMNPSKSSTTGLVFGTALGTIFGFGLGGVVTGFQESGVKGGVVGGIAGLGSVIVGSGLVAALSLPVTWPVWIGLGLIGTFSGKFAVNKIFKKEKIENFKEEIREGVRNQLHSIRGEGKLERTIEEQINQGFDAVSAKVEEETERVLKDTEKTMEDIKQNFMQMAMEKEQNEKRFDEILLTVNEVKHHIQQINNEIVEILHKY